MKPYLAPPEAISALICIKMLSMSFATIKDI
jgi:hypothetical protein